MHLSLTSNTNSHIAANENDMETDFVQKELLTEIEKLGVDFIYFVDISHLTDKQSKGYSTAIFLV